MAPSKKKKKSNPVVGVPAAVAPFMECLDRKRSASNLLPSVSFTCVTKMMRYHRDDLLFLAGKYSPLFLRMKTPP
jgi:hypothetical protein